MVVSTELGGADPRGTSRPTLTLVVDAAEAPPFGGPPRVRVTGLV